METRADTDAMRDRAAQYRAAAETHRARARWHVDTAASDTAGFGDINADVAELFEQVKHSQARAWNALADRHDDHAHTLEATATRYDTTEQANTARLGGYGT